MGLGLLVLFIIGVGGGSVALAITVGGVAAAFAGLVALKAVTTRTGYGGVKAEI